MDVDQLHGLLVAAGFEDAGVQVVRSYGQADLELLASSALSELRLDELPAEEVDAAEGRVVSVFDRGRKAKR